jgi:hypothetical protein
MADLKINATKLVVEAKKDTQLSPLVLEAFDVAIQHLGLAEQKVRRKELLDGIVDQEVVLNKLSLIAYELSKNQVKSKAEAKDSGESSGSQSKKEKKQNQMKMDLAQLKKALQGLQRQIQAQGKLNRLMKSQLGREPNAMELKELEEKQDQISSEVDRLQKMLGLDKKEFVSQQLDNAHASSLETKEQLRGGHTNQALRLGQQTQQTLLRASSELSELMGHLVQQSLAKMAQQASKLASRQEGLAKQASGIARSDSSAQSQLKQAQQDLKREVDQLRAGQQSVAQQTADLYPKLSEKLFQGLARLNQSKLDVNLKKVEKAMRYKQFRHTAKYQQKVAKSLDAFGKSISAAQSALPRITRLELQQKLESLIELQESLKNPSAAKLKQVQGDLGKLLAKLSKQLDSEAMTMLSQGVNNLPPEMEGKPEELAVFLSEVLAVSMQEVLQELLRMELDEKIKIKKKTFHIPEQYRDSVEEYFMKLSE